MLIILTQDFTQIKDLVQYQHTFFLADVFEIYHILICHHILNIEM